MWALAAYTPRAFLWMKDDDASRLSSLGDPASLKMRELGNGLSEVCIKRLGDLL